MAKTTRPPTIQKTKRSRKKYQKFHRGHRMRSSQGRGRFQFRGAQRGGSVKSWFTKFGKRLANTIVSVGTLGLADKPFQKV